MSQVLKPSTPTERKQYYKEEWKPQDIPNFISENINQREFGFDHMGKGPNNRYKIFKNTNILKKFLLYRSPFAAYCSIAFYKKPKKREDWLKAELVFDVDAKDLPIRSCQCNPSTVCETCLNESKEIVIQYLDTLKGDLGLKNIHIIYSGRGYHIRILDETVMTLNSDGRSQVLKYLVGATIPQNKYPSNDPTQKPYQLEHFIIPIGYPHVFTKLMKNNIIKLTGNEKFEDINPKLLKDTIKNKQYIENNEWGQFKTKIGPRRYQNLVEGITKINLASVDAKVSIDLKRILRLPSSLHSKVSMKCMEVKNINTFDPFDKAIPKFIQEKQ